MKSDTLNLEEHVILRAAGKTAWKVFLKSDDFSQTVQAGSIKQLSPRKFNMEITKTSLMETMDGMLQLKGSACSIAFKRIKKLHNIKGRTKVNLVM